MISQGMDMATWFSNGGKKPKISARYNMDNFIYLFIYCSANIRRVMYLPKFYTSMNNPQEDYVKDCP